MKGEAIKEKLLFLGKTQRELAGLLDITPQAVYEFLSTKKVSFKYYGLKISLL